MKKLITVFLAAIIALSTISCAKTPSENPKNIENNSMSNSMVDLTNSISYYGKISSIAGNEIDLNLAKLPEYEAPLPLPEDEGEGMVAMTMTAATAAGGTGSEGGAAQRIEPEYTGETKSFVVPAGIEIKDPMGAVKQLSDIKKGAMLDIRTDKDGNVIEVIYLG